MSKRKTRTGLSVSAAPGKNKAREKPTLDADIQNLLGRKLCDSYRAMVEEEVPARFLDLLKELTRMVAEDDEGGGA